MLECKEFVNADEIARGISPFNPERVSIQAGKLMLKRINTLLEEGETFAFESTLSSKLFVNFIKRAKEKNYEVILLFLWLNSKELAIKRVKVRVHEGGHDIPMKVIQRRYESGLRNLFQLYIPIVDKWFMVDNSEEKFKFIAEGTKNDEIVKNHDVWMQLKQKYNER